MMRRATALSKVLYVAAATDAVWSRVQLQIETVKSILEYMVTLWYVVGDGVVEYRSR